MNQSRKSVLISGSAGLLGSKLSALYKQNGYFVGAIYRSKEPKDYDVKYKVNMCDVGDFSEIRDHFELIINCAGFTNVDENEKLPEKSWLENVVASNNLSEFARKSGSKFVHVSTDHFLSDQNLVRDETATMTPVNQYGYTKLEAEKTIAKNNKESLIIRSNFFGKNSMNDNSLLEWILKEIKNKKDIRGYEDIFFNPVSIDYLFKAINILIKNSAVGIYNIGSHEAISKFNFIKLVIEILGNTDSKLINSISPVDSSSVKRPKFMALDCSKFEAATHTKAPDLSELLRIELMIN
jgi:dTDP-4-dehydrorhamnose reductase